MGMNATLHAKDTAVLNSQSDPTWQPVKSTAGALQITPTTLLTGENQQFDRLFGGSLAQYAAVGADTLIKTGPGILYGVLCTGAGTLVGLYDNTSATGTGLMLPGAMTLNQFVSFGGTGVQFDTGLYADWTSGSFIVLYI